MTDQPNASATPPQPPSQKKSGGTLSGSLGVIVFVALFSAAGYLTWNALNVAPPAEPDPPPTTYFCIETKKPFEHVVKLGEHIPVHSPHSRKNTGYPTERCYWTKDGRQKPLPTYVVLNEYLGKPDEPTICPDCGRVVTHGFKLPPAGTPMADESGGSGSPPTTGEAPSSEP